MFQGSQNIVLDANTETTKWKMRLFFHQEKKKFAKTFYDRKTPPKKRSWPQLMSMALDARMLTLIWRFATRVSIKLEGIL